MDIFAHLFANLGTGFGTALSPLNLLFGFIGVVVGTAIGVLPGIGPALTISLLLPLTFGLDPATAFILFGGIYYGAMYGGSTTSILVNTPGESASVVTTLDGFRMAKQGRGGAALATAAIGSFFAGTFATLMLMLLAPALVEFALKFGPPEYFAIMFLALTAVTGLAGESAPKAMFATLLGLGIGMVGIDLQTGQARFTFGSPHLLSGIDIVTAAIGLFAIGEVLWTAGTFRHVQEETIKTTGTLWMSRDEWSRSAPAWARGSLLGFIIGILPGAGATVATFLSYNLERRSSKTPEKFGTGMIEGVAGPEAANNASAGGSLVPLLALGIPGSGTTAMMLAAFQLYGLRPGPLLFAQRPELVWGLIASLYIGNALLLLLNLPLVGLWIKMLDVPKPLLFGSILVFSVLGVYSNEGSLIGLLVLLLLGLLAFFMRRHGFPMAPVVLGVVLGPLIEQEFRRSLLISVGNPAIFFTRPLSMVILILAFLSLLIPFAEILWKRYQARQGRAVAVPTFGDEKD
jgi:putative tricarboxylic transport membrane protein